VSIHFLNFTWIESTTVKVNRSSSWGGHLYSICEIITTLESTHSGKIQFNSDVNGNNFVFGEINWKFHGWPFPTGLPQPAQIQIQYLKNLVKFKGCISCHNEANIYAPFMLTCSLNSFAKQELWFHDDWSCLLASQSAFLGLYVGKYLIRLNLTMDELYFD
jgi:hypothetical protein